MWQDPIVAETRALREEYARKFGHDADAVFQDILERQTAPGKRLVSFPARRPVFGQTSAQGGAQASAQAGAPADAPASCD